MTSSSCSSSRKKQFRLNKELGTDLVIQTRSGPASNSFVHLCSENVRNKNFRRMTSQGNESLFSSTLLCTAECSGKNLKYPNIKQVGHFLRSYFGASSRKSFQKAVCASISVSSLRGSRRSFSYVPAKHYLIRESHTFLKRTNRTRSHCDQSFRCPRLAPDSRDARRVRNLEKVHKYRTTSVRCEWRERSKSESSNYPTPFNTSVETSRSQGEFWTIQ